MPTPDINGIQTEFLILDLLNHRPQSPADLVECTGLPRRRISTVMAQLRHADLIVQVPGTHRYMVADL